MPGDVPARLYKTGVQVAREAVDADNAREFQQALDLYKKSAEFFVAGLRADQQLQQQQRQRQIEKWGRALRPNRINKDRRKIRMNFISGKVSEFLDRAEKIHAFLKSHVAANQQPEKELTPLDAKSIDDIFKGVIGAEAAKQALLEAVYLPQKFPSVFADGRAPWSGVLLFGPPGTGKTELASAVARHNNCHFVSVSAADMVSKYQGESARNVAKLFDNARRQKGPTVIFLDEIDALGTSRADGESSDIRQVKNELLRQLDGFSSKSKRLSSEGPVTFLCATNHPWALDTALLRRLQQRIHVPLPSARERAALIAHFIRDEPHTLQPQDLSRLAARTAGYSGSDLHVLVREALMHPVREALRARYFRNVGNASHPKFVPCSKMSFGARQTRMLDLPADSVVLPPLTPHHLEQALIKTRPSVSAAEAAKHEEYTRRLGTNAAVVQTPTPSHARATRTPVARPQTAPSMSQRATSTTPQAGSGRRRNLFDHIAGFFAGNRNRQPRQSQPHRPRVAARRTSAKTGTQARVAIPS